MSTAELTHAPLGKETTYVSTHTPGLLYPIARVLNRAEISSLQPLPFHGADIWNAYELTWLDEQGKPQVAIAEFHIPCETYNIIESKSFKLYLNSLSQTKFDTADTVKSTLADILSEAAGGQVTIKLMSPNEFQQQRFQEFSGDCLDDLKITTDTYTVQPNFLKTENNTVTEETLYSNLLRSVCPVTQQPDMGSVLIHYIGKKINRDGLLKYIISFREHAEFHEHCVERMFMDILRLCQPQKLTVYARYTRRGGLDINPFRSNFETLPSNLRCGRQ